MRDREVATQQQNARRAEALAELDAHWGRGPFFAEKRRRHGAERKVRLERAERGEPSPPIEADWVIADIRSGEWEKRVRASEQSIRDQKARLTRLKREGHSFPPREKSGVTFKLDGAPAWVEAAFRRQASREHFERILSARRANVHVPERRAPVAPVTRSREHKAVGRRRTASRASPDDPSGPRPPLEVRSLARFRRDVRRALGGAT
jgi:hypothetical protein